MRKVTYEFSNVSEVVTIDDPAEWQPLKIVRGANHLNLWGPLSHSLGVNMPHSLGNQVYAVNYSLMRVSLEAEIGQPEPGWTEVYSLVQCCLSWIRTITRQYWIGVLPTPNINSPRLTILTEIDGKGTFSGAGAHSSAVVPLRLSSTVWDALTPLVQEGVFPPVSESFLCDALLHFADRDYVQAVVGLGIACELEINSFIEAILQLQPPAVREMYKLSGLRFAEKLKKVPRLLGASEFKEFKLSSFEKVIELYEKRGQAVHSGRASVLRKDDKTRKEETVPVTAQDIAPYWFAAEDLFAWTRNERNRLGISRGLTAVYRDLNTNRMKMLVVG
jgi:hypothetical protein